LADVSKPTRIIVEALCVIAIAAVVLGIVSLVIICIGAAYNNLIGTV
jgi:hypothetical protein